MALLVHTNSGHLQPEAPTPKTPSTKPQSPKTPAQDSQPSLEARGRKLPPPALLQHLHECPQAQPHCGSPESWVEEGKAGPQSWLACLAREDQGCRTPGMCGSN